MGRSGLGPFCALGRSMPWVVLCRGSFCAMGRFELGPFWAWVVLSFGPCWAWVVLSLGRFVMGRFVMCTFVNGAHFRFCIFHKDAMLFRIFSCTCLLAKHLSQSKIIFKHQLALGHYFKNGLWVDSWTRNQPGTKLYIVAWQILVSCHVIVPGNYNLFPLILRIHGMTSNFEYLREFETSKKNLI
jgi:hypothetical protein